MFSYIWYSFRERGVANGRSNKQSQSNEQNTSRSICKSRGINRKGICPSNGNVRLILEYLISRDKSQRKNDLNSYKLRKELGYHNVRNKQLFDLYFMKTNNESCKNSQN